VLEPVSLWTNEVPRLHLASWDGDGPPVLLVHGMGAHTHWWDDCAPLLAERLRPTAMDLRGHGDSDWRPDGAYGFETFAADVEEARHALGWDKFSLVGHSLGARVALEYAAAHPQRLTAVVAIDFVTETFAGGSRPQPYYDDPQAMAARYRLQPPGTTLDAAALRRLGAHSFKKSEGRYTWKFDWRCMGRPYPPVWPVLAKVKTRALVVAGGASALMNESALKRVADALPGAETAVVAKAHHHVPLDEPRALAGVLLDFLAS
jgi:pimeloyl-ACP methyl ester carboxylesterase